MFRKPSIDICRRVAVMFCKIIKLTETATQTVYAALVVNERSLMVVAIIITFLLGYKPAVYLLNTGLWPSLNAWSTVGKSKPHAPGILCFLWSCTKALISGFSYYKRVQNADNDVSHEIHKQGQIPKLFGLLTVLVTSFV